MVMFIGHFFVAKYFLNIFNCIKRSHPSSLFV